MLPKTHYDKDIPTIHESINDLPVHPATTQQIFHPTSESRVFTRADAARVFEPTLLPKSYDKHAAYRFPLAFQCIINIGVRGSEPIRSRVVQAGTLEVVGCILEAWLASKGFPVGPSVAANGMPRETREQRQARKLAQQEMRNREQAAAIARALERQIVEGAAARPVEVTVRGVREVSRLLLLVV